MLELTSTAWDMQPFAEDLGYEGEPFRWDPERRAQLRAELDAYYAYLYGLSKKELRYILDPKDVMGEDYPSETFRVLKENDIRTYGEDRTQRLVLEAYDRFANFTFLTQETNLRVSNRDPAKYLEEFVAKHPDAIRSHWIPMDRRLWRVENYREFLDARRALLAEAANDFLNGLLAGAVPEPAAMPPIVDRDVGVVPGGVAAADEDELLMAVNEWVVEQGLPEGEFLYELTDPQSGDAVAVFDLAWPDGLQEGLSEPVALLIDEPADVHDAANSAGFRFFTDVETFRAYVRQEILAVEAEVERAAA